MSSDVESTIVRQRSNNLHMRPNSRCVRTVVVVDRAISQHAREERLSSIAQKTLTSASPEHGDYQLKLAAKLRF